MGSGSIGGGGSGGSGYQRASLSTYGYENGKLKSEAPFEDDVRRKVKEQLKGLSKEYISAQFASPSTRLAYDNLFTLAGCLLEPTAPRDPGAVDQTVARRLKSADDAIEALGTTYETHFGDGFLRTWMEATMTALEQIESNEKVRGTVRMALESFLLSAVGDNPDVYVAGNVEQVLRVLDQKMFDSTSAYFLGRMIWQVLGREYSTKQIGADLVLRRVSQTLADKIVQSFKEEFIDTGRAHYRDLFRQIEAQPDWFRKGLVT